MIGKKDILMRLSEFCDLETGRWIDGTWTIEEERRNRERELKFLRQEIKSCRSCPGMNEPGVTEAVCGWGDCCSQVMIVGQSAHRDGMMTDVPFILGSGLYVDAALRTIGRSRVELFWTNAVHCHPERNRPSTTGEKHNCMHYLADEIALVQPTLLVAMGNDAKEAIRSIEQETEKRVASRVFYCKHPAALMRGASPDEVVGWVIKLAAQLAKVFDS